MIPTSTVTTRGHHSHTQAIGRAARHVTRSQMLQNAGVLFQAGRDGRKRGVELGTQPIHHGNDCDEMPAAINPYSIAVAPNSFFRKAVILDIIRLPPYGSTHRKGTIELLKINVPDHSICRTNTRECGEPFRLSAGALPTINDVSATRPLCGAPKLKS